MNQTTDLNCEACGFQTQNLASMNKHLVQCEKYDEWIKTYIPPKTHQCRGCEKIFVDKKIYENHVYECYIK